MENKIEIQLLTQATRQQLLELRDEIRKIKGMEGFELEIPRSVIKEGTMGGGGDDIMFEIAKAVLTGIGHFASEKTYEYLPEIKNAFNRVLKKGKYKADAGDKMGSNKEWEIVITNETGGIKKNIYLNDEGEQKDFSTSRYSIKPDKTFALLIGTATYDDSENFPPIKPVGQNLKDMEMILTDMRLMGLPEKNVLSLLDETSVNIRRAISEISKRNDIDTLLVYFTGHGQNTGDNQLRIITKDTHKIDEELLNDIPYTYVRDKLRSSRALQKIILLDTCHSGLATQGPGDEFDLEIVSGTFTLASTSADESAYFKKEASNTYFTGYLIDILRNGIANTNEMLSLQDLFEHTKKKLADAKLPAPTCKSQLENIIAEKFFISHNPAFLLDDRLKRPRQLYEAGDHEGAKKDYLFLINEYPQNSNLNHEYLEFEKNIMYNSLVDEADKLFYEDKNYVKALSKYKEALSIKAEDHVRNKIIECRKKDATHEIPAKIAIKKKELHEQPAENEPLGASHAAHSLSSEKKGSLRPLILVSILLISTITYLFIKPHKDSEKEGLSITAGNDTAVNKKNSDKQSLPAIPTKDKMDSTQKPKVVDLKSQDLVKNIGKSEKRSEENDSKTQVTEKSSSIADILSGTTYEESITLNSLSFSYTIKNRIHFEGLIADYPVSGDFIVYENKSLRTNSGNLEGNLTLSEDQRLLTGYLKIKDRDVTKKLNLKKK